MKALKIFVLFFLVGTTAAIAQEFPQKLIAVKAFASLPASVQQNSAYQTFLSRIASLSLSQSVTISQPGPFPASIAFDLVGSGKVNAMWTQSSYFSAKELSFVMFTYPPFITADDFVEWRGLPDTVQMADSLYGRYGVKAIPCAMIDSNMDFALRRIPGGEYGLKGAKLVINGELNDLYSAIGVTPMGMPFGELANLMKSGVIDGFHAWSPHESIEMRLYPDVQALVHPSKVRGFASIDLLVNLRFWNDLRETDRTAVSEICRTLIDETRASSRKLALNAVEKYRSTGVAVISLSESDNDRIRAKWVEAAAKRSVFDPVFQKIHRSLYKK